MAVVCAFSGKSNQDDIKMTPEEVEALNVELRVLGGANFMRKYIHGEERFTIKEILYALGYTLVLNCFRVMLTVA